MLVGNSGVREQVVLRQKARGTRQTDDGVKRVRVIELKYCLREIQPSKFIEIIQQSQTIDKSRIVNADQRTAP